ncbi:hypothetical protein GCM10012275_28840 [Longimycelium tulufanense]|uniref:Uncharacterized protein n=1 Tax=Longimycelium tulufanense TaxID=907463 RepID=A0A8J3C8H5_9PSEU|nr:hypothetical protein [Longimycelium tulufanense]GGM55949.1 hypothetical protein GCM10012275_28840 [Longimycelium tulufanense]
MIVNDTWQIRQIHWHVYREPRDGPTTDRTARLRSTPVAVLWTPDQVADWLDEHAARHGAGRPVMLIGGGGWAATFDEGDRDRLVGENLAVVEAGRSLYTVHGPWWVYVEAVTDCPIHPAE